MKINFDHRLAHPNDTSGLNLVDSVNGMSARATATLTSFITFFEEFGNFPRTEPFTGLLDTVRMEIKDIKLTVEAFIDDNNENRQYC